VIEELTASDQFVEYRQLGALDSQGSFEARTGAQNKPWAGHRTARNVVVAANAVVEGVGDAMSESFQKTPDTPLWERLLMALEAGKATGGQPNGERSAALYVVDREPYATVDLRVDLHSNPVTELRRMADQYFPLIQYYGLRPSNPRLPRAEEWLAEQRPLLR
jgi:uncharacterized Ntn-hydrolase superfamily protein